MSAWSHLGTSGLGFASLTFAYLVAAYVVGRELAGGIAFGLSAIYTLVLFGPLMGIWGTLNQMNWVASEYSRLYPEGTAMGDGISGVTVLLTTLPYLLGWAASIAYLHVYVPRNVREQSQIT